MGFEFLENSNDAGSIFLSGLSLRQDFRGANVDAIAEKANHCHFVTDLEA